MAENPTIYFLYFRGRSGRPEIFKKLQGFTADQASAISKAIELELVRLDRREFDRLEESSPALFRYFTDPLIESLLNNRRLIDYEIDVVVAEDSDQAELLHALGVCPRVENNVRRWKRCDSDRDFQRLNLDLDDQLSVWFWLLAEQAESDLRVLAGEKPMSNVRLETKTRKEEDHSEVGEPSKDTHDSVDPIAKNQPLDGGSDKAGDNNEPLTSAEKDIFEALDGSDNPQTAKEIAARSKRSLDAVKKILKPKELLRGRYNVFHRPGAGYYRSPFQR